MSHVVISKDGARACIAVEALALHEDRGFTLLGPADRPGSTTTVEEAAASTVAAVAAADKINAQRVQSDKALAAAIKAERARQTTRAPRTNKKED